MITSKNKLLTIFLMGIAISQIAYPMHQEVSQPLAPEVSIKEIIKQTVEGYVIDGKNHCYKGKLYTFAHGIIPGGIETVDMVFIRVVEEYKNNPENSYFQGLDCNQINAKIICDIEDCLKTILEQQKITPELKISVAKVTIQPSDSYLPCEGSMDANFKTALIIARVTAVQRQATREKDVYSGNHFHLTLTCDEQ